MGLTGSICCVINALTLFFQDIIEDNTCYHTILLRRILFGRKLKWELSFRKTILFHFQEKVLDPQDFRKSVIGNFIKTVGTIPSETISIACLAPLEQIISLFLLLLQVRIHFSLRPKYVSACYGSLPHHSRKKQVLLELCSPAD